MTPSEIKSLIRECLSEVLAEGEVVCAWCKKKLKDAPEISGTSHGICQKCKDEMMGSIKKPDKLQAP